MTAYKIISGLVCLYLLSGCVNTPTALDYSALRHADPHSILILPPINQTPEVIAPYSVMAQMATPIAESGYYVFPVALVDQTFKNNGLTVAEDVHTVPFSKLQEIFGADAGLYITITNYGTSYVILSSETRVSMTASLIDLHTGTLLWKGAASASSAENQQNNNSLVGMLVNAAVNQIVETIADRGFNIAAIASHRLVSAQTYNGLLYGPRSPQYGQPVPSEKTH
jgi:hypothetical protein